MDDKPFGSEYAKSGRATCKLCKSSIGEGTLRLAINVQSPFFDGKMPNWHHFACFFKKAKIKDPKEIKGFECLRYEDQKRIKVKLGIETEEVDDSIDMTDEKEDETNIDNYSIEYARSNRSKCKECEIKIAKNEIRVFYKPADDAEGWLHLDCFSKNKEKFKFNYAPEEIPGFDALADDDKKIVKSSIGPMLKRKNEQQDDDSKSSKKIKIEPNSKASQLKVQSKKFWQLRDSLNNELTNDSIKYLIEDNDQKCSVTGRDDLLQFLADIMLFGPLERCPECKNGQLVFKGTAYKCKGDLTEWTKCMYKTQTPLRKDSFKIDQDLKVYSCLNKFQFEPNQVRIFEKSLEEMTEELEQVNVKQEAENPKQPLMRMNFSTTAKLNLKNSEIKLLIERLGGKLVTHLDDSTVALISNSEQLDKMGKKIERAFTLNVHVIDEKFLFDLNEKPAEQLGSIEDLILKHNIAQWGADLKTRIQTCIGLNQLHEKLKQDNKESKFSLKSTGTVRLKVKGGAAVDPDSGLEDDGHILCELKTNDPYSCVLGLVDIYRGTNSYYKIQLIEHDKKTKFYVFRAWGRVGTTIGGNKITGYTKKEEALDEFKETYLKQTGNDWDYRKTATKQPNKFYPLEMDYGEDENNDDENSNTSNKDKISKSNLKQPIQDLIKLIFDIETMKRQMKEFEIDLNKMPLGKISANQIKMAFSILSELNTLIEKKGSETLILDASNRFYTLIPHDFGMRKPTLLNNSTIIKEKTDMLNNLLEIEIAYNIIKTDKLADQDIDPLDHHYKKLNCDLDVLDMNTSEYEHLVQYLTNTHGSTHSQYKLKVKDIFKVCRNGEDEKFEKYKSLHNRQLLWHGSRLTNYGGILSQGLRIAPPEAPSTGYMFGKGVYFADMVSKSANYCFANSSNPTGLLLLCDVALGDMYEKKGSEYIEKLPNGKHSTKGLGRTHPDPNELLKSDDGVTIPFGKGVESGVADSSLLYNEYIVYDTAQVKIKYLIKVDFDFVW